MQTYNCAANALVLGVAEQEIQHFGWDVPAALSNVVQAQRHCFDGPHWGLRTVNPNVVAHRLPQRTVWRHHSHPLRREPLRGRVVVAPANDEIELGHRVVVRRALLVGEVDEYLASVHGQQHQHGWRQRHYHNTHAPPNEVNNNSSGGSNDCCRRKAGNTHPVNDPRRACQHEKNEVTAWCRSWPWYSLGTTS